MEAVRSACRSREPDGYGPRLPPHVGGPRPRLHRTAAGPAARTALCRMQGKAAQARRLRPRTSWLPSAPGRAAGCPRLRPASANLPVISSLVSQARLLQRMGLPVVTVADDAWERITRAQLQRWVDEYHYSPRGAMHPPWLSRRWWLRDLRLANASKSGGRHRQVDSAQIPLGAGSDDSAATAASLAGAWASWARGAPLPLSWTRPSRGAHGG